MCNQRCFQSQTNKRRVLKEEHIVEQVQRRVRNKSVDTVSVPEEVILLWDGDDNLNRSTGSGIQSWRLGDIQLSFQVSGGIEVHGSSVFSPLRRARGRERPKSHCRSRVRGFVAWWLCGEHVSPCCKQITPSDRGGNNKRLRKLTRCRNRGSRKTSTAAASC